MKASKRVARGPPGRRLSSLLFTWRRLEREGALVAVGAGEAVVPASELAAARAEIAKLQRVLGKKTLENEILKEAVEIAAAKNGLRARPCCPGTINEVGLLGAGRGALESACVDLQQDGYIDQFFVDAWQGGKGLGFALLRFLLARAEAEGLPAIHSHVSLTAEPLFAKAGFFVEERRVVELRGVLFSNALMCRLLVR